MRYLVLGEVDKIQSFVFGSAHLREVVGGSKLLLDFEEAVRGPGGLDPAPDEVLAAAGGSLRLVYADDRAAVRGIRAIRALFTEMVGGSITLSGPHNYREGREVDDMNLAYQALRLAKIEGGSPEPLLDSPFIAICSLCGRGHAQAFGTRDKRGGERRRYICRMCQHKSAAASGRDDLYAGLREKLKDLLKGQPVGFYSDYLKAETYGKADRRNYVAYMVADGNNMGRVFNELRNPDSASLLSERLPRITEQALAEACYGVMDQQEGSHGKLPVLPLILGGDDIFVLVPAPWALDITRRYCEAFDRLVQDFMTNDILALEHAIDPAVKLPAVSVSAVAVVCKASYPYRLAHEHAEDLLRRVKRAAKEFEPARTMLGMDLVLGNDIIRADIRREPLIVTPEAAQTLLNQRFTLHEPLISRSTHHALRTALSKGADVTPILNRVRDIEPLEYRRVEDAQKALADPRNWPDLLQAYFACVDETKAQGSSETEAKAACGAAYAESASPKVNAALLNIFTFWDYTFSLDRLTGQYFGTEEPTYEHTTDVSA